MNAITWQADEAAARPRYEANLVPLAQPARARLSTFLGYAPEVRHSLAAELWLRQVLAQDVYHLPSEATVLDRKAMLYVKYRAVLTAQGKAAAYSSPLWAATGSAL